MSFRCPRAKGCQRDNASGLTLLELLIGLSLFSLLSGLAVPACIRSVQVGNLTLTSRTLLAHMRFAQSAAQADGHAALIKLSPYTPFYQTYRMGQLVDKVNFSPGVGYFDGYLQLPTYTLSYDLLGNAQTSGVIRMVNNADEQDITLYMGSGFQSPGG